MNKNYKKQIKKCLEIKNDSREKLINDKKKLP